MARSSLSISEARRVALAAQGFGRARPTGKINKGHIRRVINRLGLLQLDFVNVLVPAQYLVIYSRLGVYDRACFDNLVNGGQYFTEHWAHEASIVPTALWPLLEYRRKAFKPYPNSPIEKLKAKSRYLANTIDLIKENGAVTCQDLPEVKGPKRKAGDWHRGVPRSALEYHFGFGALAVAGRLKNFQRVYDLPERVIDAEILNQSIDPEDSLRELLKIAADAHGVATTQDLADYFRMTATEAQPRVDELVETGYVTPVTVEGWQKTAYLAKSARLPKRMSCRSLLSPFDPVVWFRPRGERLFDFHYRIEIYVPAAKRQYGYYVLPFLCEDRIAGRIDLKADRQARTLLVQASHKEACVDATKTAEALAKELGELAGWLELDQIKVARRGNLATTLRKTVNSKTCRHR